MRRSVLIILAVAALAWIVLALVLGSASLRLFSSTATADSPSCLPSTLEHTAAVAGTSLDVSPAPETNTANPATQISFLGAPGAELHEVSVVGEHSGHHSGRLRGYSQGDGASFAPDTPFDAGERVSVAATLDTATGARRIAFRYNLPALFKKDFPNVVDLIELKNVDVVVRPSSEPAPPQGQTIMRSVFAGRPD